MKYLMTTISAAVILSACGGGTAMTPSDMLIADMQASVSEDRILFGQQDAYMYGHTWRASGMESRFRTDVADVCGSHPAVLGLDLGGIELGHSDNLDGNPFDYMRLAALEHYERGGIITFSWHPRNPLTGGDAWDVSDTTTVHSILPGNDNHIKFMGWLDKVADYLNSIQTSEGVKVPVLFRPWHEHTGSWFWWGKNLCSTEDYQALWRMTYDRLQEKGATQLLYAYSPGTEPKDSTEYLERYPGDDIVDLIGVDAYQFDKDAYVKSLDNALTIMSQVSKAHKKLMAVTETGYETIPDSLWWTQTLMPVIEKYPISYVLVWRNARERENHYYAPYPGHPSAADFVNFYNDPRTLFAGDMKTIK